MRSRQWRGGAVVKGRFRLLLSVEVDTRIAIGAAVVSILASLVLRALLWS